jgi:hypothetical protein
MTRMTTPQERLARMRKSFAKNKSVLTEDYKYFIAPDKAAKHPRKKSEEIQQMSVNPISMVMSSTLTPTPPVLVCPLRGLPR